MQSVIDEALRSGQWDTLIDSGGGGNKRKVPGLEDFRS